MNILRFAALCCLLAIVVESKRSWRTEDQFEIELISKNQTSIQARFRRLRKVGKYLVNIYVKYLADVGAAYTKQLKGKRDRHADGYYYIDTGNVLEPGTLYEMAVYQRKPHRSLKRIDVTTDCSVYTYPCMTSRRESCLEREQLCDGFDDCLDKSDEEWLNSTCAVTLPERPVPPPPPVDTPCMTALIASLGLTNDSEHGVTDPERPTCDENGHYAPVKCDAATCHCIHPLNGKVLKTRSDFDPFVDHDFTGICMKKYKRILARENKRKNKDSAPQTHLPDTVPPLAGAQSPELAPL